jgi:antitoxin FitA
MATLTIRNLDDALKGRLRLRAAARNRSMEEEVRQILRVVLQEPTLPGPDLGSRVRARFAGLGDVKLEIAAREPVRLPPPLDRDRAPPRTRPRK